MNIEQLIENPLIKSLSPNEFKAYIILYTNAKNSKISKFTIRGLVREWKEDETINMPCAKNTVKDIIRSLQDKKLINYDMKKEELKIL